MRMFSAHLERLPPSDFSAIRQDIPTDVWQAVQTAARFSWLPLEVNLACTRAVHDRLGEAESQDFFRGLILATTASPLLGSLVASVLRIAASDASLAIVGIPKGYDLIFRDVGRWQIIERTRGRTILELRDLPLGCFTTPGWIGSVVGALRGLGDLVKLQISSVSAQVDEPSRKVRFIGEWT